MTTAPSARFLLGLGILTIATCCWLFSFNPSLIYPDAYDYAQMGREIARGNGFSSQQLFPRHIPFLAEHDLWDTRPWPNLYRYPATPFWVAATMLFIDDPIYASVIQSGIWFVLSALLVFLLASRFTNLGVAFFSALIFISEPAIFESAHSGMTEPFATFVVLAFFLTAHGRTDTRWCWLSLGLLCGIGYLTRTQLFVLLPIGIGYLWLSKDAKHRCQSIILLFLGALIAVSPWMIRNIDVAEDPFFSFSTSRNLVKQDHATDIALDLNADPYTLSLVRDNRAFIVSKFFRNLGLALTPFFWAKMFGLGFLVVLLFLPAAVFFTIKSRDSDHRRFHYGAACLLLFTIIAVSAASHHPRFYLPLKPLMIIAASISCWKSILRWNQNRITSKVIKRLTAAAIVIGMLLCFYVSLQQQKENRQRVAREEVHRSAHARLSEIIPTDAIIFSDVSFRVVLNADRPSIRLPRNPDELWEISNRFGEFGYILIGERHLRNAGAYAPTAYQDFVTSETFLSQFELLEILSNGEKLYVRTHTAESQMNDE